MKLLFKKMFINLLILLFIVYGFSFNPEFKNFSLFLIIGFVVDLIFINSISNSSLEVKNKLFKYLHQEGLIFVSKSILLNNILKTYYLFFIFYFLFLNQYSFALFFVVYYFVYFDYRKMMTSILLPD